MHKNNVKISERTITEISTVNGIRFTLNDGSWGLIRASSNKPSLVIVIESVQSIREGIQLLRVIERITVSKPDYQIVCIVAPEVAELISSIKAVKELILFQGNDPKGFFIIGSLLELSSFLSRFNP